MQNKIGPISFCIAIEKYYVLGDNPLQYSLFYMRAIEVDESIDKLKTIGLWTTDLGRAIWSSNVESLIQEIPPKLIFDDTIYNKLGFISFQASYSMRTEYDPPEAGPIVQDYKEIQSDLIRLKDIIPWPKALDILNNSP